MKIDITHNLDKFPGIARVVKKQIDYAHIKTLNDLAFLARTEINGEMLSQFDRPTPWTMRSIEVIKATRQKPEAWVGLKGKEYKDPYPRALGHHYVGGNREWKRVEAAFTRMGILPAGMAMMPGDGAPLDQYGNVPVGFIKQMMSYFRVNRDVGVTSNSTRKSRKGIERRQLKRMGGGADRVHFFLHSYVKGRRLEPGIYQSTRYGRTTEVEPIFIFTKRPRYRRRIDLEEIAARVGGQAVVMFNKHFTQAMATARW